MACFSSRKEVAAIQHVSGISLYSCDGGSIIVNALWCNGRIDCRNSEGETHCSLCSEQLSVTCLASCILPECTCSMFYYQCEGGGCVHYDHLCDASSDCPLGDDESLCHEQKMILKFDASFIRSSFIIGLCDLPVGDLLSCRSKHQFYNSSAICHYDHNHDVMAHCEDGSHLGSGSLSLY